MATPSKVVAANSARRSSRSRKTSSSSMRWLMSRRMLVNIRWPATLIWEIEASTGNISPLARRARTQPEPIGWRQLTPVRPKLRMSSACLRRTSSGSSMSRVWPSAAAAGRPNIRSAAGLNSTMRRFSSTLTMASIADSTSPANNCSFLCKSVSACCACRNSFCKCSMAGGVGIPASGRK